MSERVTEVVPELYHPMIQFGNFSILSDEGPQQSDPLGGLLFCLAIPSNLAFYCFFPYNRFHGRRFTWGPLSTVSSDVDLFLRKGAKICLQLNVVKCEVISKALFNPEGSLAGFSTLIRLMPFCSAFHWLVVVQPQITPSKPGVQIFVQPSLDLKLFPPTMH